MLPGTLMTVRLWLPLVLWAGVSAIAQWGAIEWAALAASALVHGCYYRTLLHGYAVSDLVDYFGNLLRVPLMLPFALRDPAAFKSDCRTRWRPALVIAGLGPLSSIMLPYAVRMAPLSHVAPAREVLFAALAGGTLLGEGDRWLRLAGAASMACGVVALALG